MKTKFTDTGLDASTNYTYKVRAVDPAGNHSLRSKLLTVKIAADTEPPGKPKSFKVTASTSTSVSLQWKKATDNHGIDHYRVYADGSLVGTTTTRTYTVAGLDPKTSYKFKVRAVDIGDNLGPRSKIIVGETTALSLSLCGRGRPGPTTMTMSTRGPHGASQDSTITGGRPERPSWGMATTHACCSACLGGARSRHRCPRFRDRPHLLPIVRIDGTTSRWIGGAHDHVTSLTTSGRTMTGI